MKTQLNLLEGEQIISQGSELTLTNMRVIHKIENNNQSNTTSIFLKDISAVDVSFKASKTLAYFVSALFVVTGYLLTMNFINDYSNIEFTIVAGGAFLGFSYSYAKSQKHSLTIYSHGNAKIRFQKSGINKANLQNFIDQLEQAKNLVQA